VEGKFWGCEKGAEWGKILQFVVHKILLCDVISVRFLIFVNLSYFSLILASSATEMKKYVVGFLCAKHHTRPFCPTLLIFPSGKNSNSPFVRKTIDMTSKFLSKPFSLK
jgi:hypothetical protein